MPSALQVSTGTSSAMAILRPPNGAFFVSTTMTPFCPREPQSFAPFSPDRTVMERMSSVLMFRSFKRFTSITLPSTTMSPNLPPSAMPSVNMSSMFRTMDVSGLATISADKSSCDVASSTPFGCGSSDSPNVLITCATSGTASSTGATAFSMCALMGWLSATSRSPAGASSKYFDRHTLRVFFLLIMMILRFNGK